ncbi:competence type IV pilus ATPase ComGA [Planomicrobium sp. CPCC 101110]|uniref:competence type IV pilus ATPase ComGA n=1 Tax=Planomicrobium sp. CPCC 101110 TaxID=2599619 RepID=UPI0011B78C97|nr:competence type IV pilus ATPase ComGA [Planomicrobium sp. CPCC 101110]TWT26144.1 competence protein ComG [Planomicrobium sp. CPCC 101110]
MHSIVEKRCAELLHAAADASTTDIHIKPDSTGYSVSFRSFQHLRQVMTIPLDLGDRMIAYFKYLSLLDMSEKRKPQTGSFHLPIHQHPYYFRISTLPSVLTRESIVIRVIPDKAAQSIHQLAAFRDSARLLEKLAEAPQGLILLTGPTGCGKSTTLYSLLKHCAETLNRNIITLEDPVERKNQSMLQIQVNEKAGLTYAAGLKAILRHDPDIIMIGEIRDADTAQIAVRAALTGHLVFSTIHARHSVGCLHRLFDLGISYEDMAQTLIAISAQRIVPVFPEMGHQTAAHRALYEILYGERLSEALQSAKDRKAYELPEPLTFGGQIREGVKIGAIEASCALKPDFPV